MEGESRIIRFPAPSADLPDVQQVFQEHEKRLLRYLRTRLRSAIEAQDAAQLSFLRLWQRRDQLHDENLVSLLYVTARNVANDMLRKRARAGSASFDGAPAGQELANVRDDRPDADRILRARHDVALVERLIAELPPKCRHAFIAYKFDERSYAEIAGEMGLSESMVRKYVLKAVAHCAARFAELEGWE